MNKSIAVALIAAIACSSAFAQSKKELVAKAVQLAQPGVEQLARGIVEQPAVQLLQRARSSMSRVPADKREAVAKEVQAEVKAYVDELTPVLRERAVKLLPETLGTMLESKFTEDELKALIAWQESPVNRKYQEVAPQVQRDLLQKLIADSRGTIEPKLRALDASVSKRLAQAAPPAAAASAASGPARRP